MSDLSLSVDSAHPDYAPQEIDFSIAKQILLVSFDDYSVAIYEGADDSAFLCWTDGINEWVEHFVHLHQAIARFALLQACAESTWEKVFTQNPRQFVVEFEKFTDSAVQ